MATDDFITGYLLACANLVHLHDRPGLAADVLHEAQITWADVQRLGLTDFDLAALRKIRQEKSRHPFAPGSPQLTPPVKE